MGAVWKLGFLVSVLIFLLAAQTYGAEDGIAVGESLTGTQTRVSNNTNFKLGFFKINRTNDWYVGIWYAPIPETVSWVANKDFPLQNNSGTLNLTEEGSLVVSYKGSVIWSTNATKKASSAAIMDSGNLVVYGADNKSEIIWQSFDNPGNTWMPGMKIGMNQKLTSWKSPWDPSPGSYSLELDADNNQFVIKWQNSITYWESGSWNGQIFSKVPEMTLNYIYDFSYFNNGSVKYFTYSVKPQLTYLSRFVMAETGDIKVYSLLDTTNQWSMFWAQPRDQCDVYALCGAYGSCNQNNVQFCSCLQGFNAKDSRAWESQDWSGGCVRQTGLDCSSNGNRTTDGFMELQGKSTPPDVHQFQGYSSIDLCQAACLRNCSCTAYAYVTNGTSPTCQLWFGELLNLVDTTTATANSLFIRLAASDVPKTGSNKKATVAGAVAGVVAGLAAILAVILGLFLWCRRRRASSKLGDYTPGSLTVFSYKELQIATNNFSERLGGGGFGSVFKGKLSDKTTVAVKKLEGINQGEKQFRMEVSTIGTIQHVNLVRLLGFCSEGANRLLVYDYMSNGSLNTFLFRKTERVQVLDWKTRFGIALGTARGILYLHEKCRDCIIHCDIKPENILLESDFCPKVADFGLAKLVGREFSHVLTTMRGTRGYLAPEWISGLPITVKADVYSFGMTLLEIIAGRRNMEGDPQSSELFFPTWAATQINTGNSMALLDKKLNGNADPEQLKRAAMAAGWCIQDDEDARPTMNQVVQILEGIGDIAVPPIPRSLQALAVKTNSIVFYWDKETAPEPNTSSAGSNPATSSKSSENFSTSRASLEVSDAASSPAT